jgi:hypothetical protein
MHAWDSSSDSSDFDADADELMEQVQAWTQGEAVEWLPDFNEWSKQLAGRGVLEIHDILADLVLDRADKVRDGRQGGRAQGNLPRPNEGPQTESTSRQQ